MPSLIIIVRMCRQGRGTVFLLSLLASDKGKTPPEARQAQYSGKSKQNQFTETERPCSNGTRLALVL